MRGFVVLPLLTQGQLYAVYLFFTTGGGGSVSLITSVYLWVQEAVALPLVCEVTGTIWLTQAGSA